MKFRKKPVLVDAVQYTPGLEDGYACYELGGRFVGYYDKNSAIPRVVQKPAIKTLEGFHEISAGDWIITGVDGERYPCKPDIFVQTYEAADGPSHEEESQYALELLREKYAYWRGNRPYGHAAADGLVFGLDMLSIKIEGVNA